MKDFLKYGLIGGGIAFVLFREQIAAVISGHATTPAGGAQPQGTNGGTTPAGTTTTTTAPAGVWAQIATAAGGTGAVLNFHEWNYLYAMIRKVPGPAPEAVGQGDGMRAISFAEYQAAMTAAGLSGLSRAAVVAAAHAPRPATGTHGAAVAAAAHAANESRRLTPPEPARPIDRRPGASTRRAWSY